MAGRFAFRLEKVLRYRAHLEKRVRLQLCEAVNRLEEQEKLLVTMGAARIEATRTLDDERTRGIAVSRDHLFALFLRGLGERMEEADNELEKRRERMEFARNLLAVAAGKKKSLEVVKEVMLERFKKELEKREQANLDDLVLMTRKVEEP